MNIGRRYWSSDLSNIPESAHKNVLRNYCKSLEQHFMDGWGLFFWGKNSTGKTYASTGLLKFVVSRGYTAFCVVADELKLAFLQKRDEDRETTLSRVLTVDFLLIEDLGKEYSASSGFAELHLENLLRHRSRELLPTIITTNLSPAEFKERYRQSTAAIALESMIAVEVKGPDWRKAAFQAKMYK